jgi:hypothetical protein
MRLVQTIVAVKRENLGAAIPAEIARARMEEDGRRWSVAINPALLDGRE